MTPFEFVQTVRFAHCDPAGIVFYPRYHEMLNTTVEQWCDQALGYSFAEMHLKDHVGFPTVKQSIEYFSPSYLGDELHFVLRPVYVGRSSVDIVVEAFCGGELRVRFENRLVFACMKTHKSAEIPERIRGKITEALAA